MPIHDSWSSTIQGLNNQYCKGKNDGAPAPFKCKKARQVFYAMIKKNGWDETKPRPSKGSKAWEDAHDFKVLTTKARNKLKKSSFCDPENRRYPAHDAAHVRNGLARIQQNKSDPKYDSILRCLLSRAKKFGIKTTVKKKGDNVQYPDSDFALVRYQDEPPAKCVCPECGATVDNPENKHCPDMKCPKCGASMRARKPGTGGGKGKGSKNAPEHTERMFQYSVNGVLDIQLLYDSLATLPYYELSDEEYLLTLYFLMDRANIFIRVMENE